MKRRRVSRWLTVKLWAPLLAGGLALQFNLTGCDPEVRDAVLGGVQTSLTGLITSVINAFFLSLQDAGTTTSQPVVKAVFENLSGWLA
ncbi:MAG: hypothetical protein JXQ75_23435 [Phycisphaerae bacterium]|nr:hypothetical protein [Phycisphaerae bacterium]